MVASSTPDEKYRRLWIRLKRYLTREMNGHEAHAKRASRFGRDALPAARAAVCWLVRRQMDQMEDTDGR